MILSRLHPRPKHWSLALLGALAAHAALALLFYQPANSGAVATGVGGIEVSLGPAGAAPGAAETSAPAEAVIPEASEAAVPDAVQEVAVVTAPETAAVDSVTAEALVTPAEVPLYAPLDVVEPEVPETEDLVSEVIAEAAPEVDAATPPEPLQEAAAIDVMRTPPKPLAKPKAKPRDPPDAVEPEIAAREVPQPADSENLTAAQEAAAAVDSPTNREPGPAALRGDGGKAGSGRAATAGTAEGKSGGGTPGASANYKALLLAWLEKHKEYPRRARLRRQQGTAHLFFVIDRSGRLIDYRIDKSSGHKLLDKEVAAMIERAAPLPAVPGAAQVGRLEFVVPVRFNLR